MNTSPSPLSGENPSIPDPAPDHTAPWRLYAALRGERGSPLDGGERGWVFGGVSGGPRTLALSGGLRGAAGLGLDAGSANLLALSDGGLLGSALA